MFLYIQTMKKWVFTTSGGCRGRGEGIVAERLIQHCPPPTHTFFLLMPLPQVPIQVSLLGPLPGIVIGSLVGMALVGVGVYFLYSCCWNETPRENEAPVPVYENLPPTAGPGPVAQPGRPPDPSPMYETLQPRQLDVYKELKK
ncbi:unnamed protein product [Natator depressus]